MGETQNLIQNQDFGRRKNWILKRKSRFKGFRYRWFQIWWSRIEIRKELDKMINFQFLEIDFWVRKEKIQIEFQVFRCRVFTFRNKLPKFWKIEFSNFGRVEFCIFIQFCPKILGPIYKHFPRISLYNYPKYFPNFSSTDRVDDMREQLRKDSELPRCKKSNTDTEEPNTKSRFWSKKNLNFGAKKLKRYVWQMMAPNSDSNGNYKKQIEIQNLKLWTMPENEILTFRNKIPNQTHGFELSNVKFLFWRINCETKFQKKKKSKFGRTRVPNFISKLISLIKILTKLNNNIWNFLKMYRSICTIQFSLKIENRIDSRHNAQNNSWGNFSWTKTTNTEYRHGRSKTSHRSEWQRTADVNLFQHWSSSTKSSSATQRQRTTEVRKINHRDLIDAGWPNTKSRFWSKKNLKWK